MATDSPLRQRLVARDDVDEADVDDIIEIAARLQDDARLDGTDRISLAEVQSVAAELDIDPTYVEVAIIQLQDRRAAEAHRAVVRRQLAMRWGLGFVVVFFVSLGLTFGLAALSVPGLRRAAEDAHGAEARLATVLERQASLAPQLVALAGGEGGDLPALAASVRNAPDIDEKLRAAEVLGQGMAARLAALPPPQSEAEATLRLQLHDEIAGGQNRVTTELRRYREAEAAWRDEASGPFAGLAVGLGMADAPPAPAGAAGAAEAP